MTGKMENEFELFQNFAWLIQDEDYFEKNLKTFEKNGYITAHMMNLQSGKTVEFCLCECMGELKC